MTSRFITDTRPSGVSARSISRFTNGESAHVDVKWLAIDEIDRRFRLERRHPQRRHRPANLRFEHPLAVAARHAVHVRALADLPVLDERHGHERAVAAKARVEHERLTADRHGQEHVRARRRGPRRHHHHASRVRDGLKADLLECRSETASSARSSSRRAWR